MRGAGGAHSCQLLHPGWFFLAQPESNGWDSQAAIGTTTVRVEVFVDDPDAFVERAIAAGANCSVDGMQDHQRPRGPHRQGGFYDPFGHLWLVGDKSPLSQFRGSRPYLAPELAAAAPVPGPYRTGQPG